jgi:hypothetical protein
VVTDTLEVEVTVSGSSEPMRVSRCVLHVTGELAGNVDLVVAATPRVQNAARSDLRLDVADAPEALRAIADGQEEDGLGLTFHAAGLEGVEPPPTSFRLTWGRGGQELGEVRCVVAEAEPEPPEPQRGRGPAPAPGSGRVPSPIRIRTCGEWAEIESRWVGLTRPLASVLLVAVVILAGPLGATGSDALAPVLAVAVMGFLLCAAIPASLIRYHRSRRMLQQRWTWRLPPLPRVVVGSRELPVLSSHQIVIRREMSHGSDGSGQTQTNAIYLQLSRDERFQLARCRAPAGADVAALELSELLGVPVRG